MSDKTFDRYADAFDRGWDAIELLLLGSLELGVWALVKSAGVVEWCASRTREKPSSPRSEAP